MSIDINEIYLYKSNRFLSCFIHGKFSSLFQLLRVHKHEGAVQLRVKSVCLSV